MILRPATNDLTLVYYSANALPENVANNFRRELLNVTKGIFPIISVTQKPVDFGNNIFGIALNLEEKKEKEFNKNK